MNPQLEDSTIADALTTFQRLVAAGDYEAALEQWHNLRGQVDDYTYWLNLGSVQTLRDKLPEARFAFEKARHSTVYSRQLEEALAQVKQSLETGSGYGIEHNTPASTVLFFLGPMKFAFLGLLILAAILVFLKRLSTIARLTLLSAGLVPLAIAGYLQFQTVAFVSLAAHKIYEGPSAAFPTPRVVLPGNRLLAVPQGNWLRVERADGEVAWLAKDEVSKNVGLLWGAWE